jgi:DNA helicase-2/ATP-dependent DNA helicase PcrA
MLVSNEQSLAISFTGHAIIVAVPGSGKTRTLVAKAVAMISAGYSDIGIVSFTNASAKELKERLIDELSPELVERHTKISTFHSMMLEHIKNHLVGTGLVNPNIETTHLVSILNQHGLPSTKIDDLKNYFNLEPCDRKEADELYAPCEQYLVEVMQNRHITLNNVIEQGTKMIIERQIPPLPFSYLFVDEFQDSSPDQVQMLLVHGVSGTTVVTSGDDDQSIYSWRGAKGVEAFNSVQEKLGAERFILSTNYRSHKEITDIANTVIARNKNRIDKTITSKKGAGGTVSLTLYKTAFDESSYICERINNLVTNGFDRDIFVIARSNAALDFYRENLEVDFIDLAGKSKEPYESQVLKAGLQALAVNNDKSLAIMLSVYLPVDSARSIAATVLNKPGQHSSSFEHIQPLSHVKELIGKGRDDDAIREFIAYAGPYLLKSCESKKKNAEQIQTTKERMQRSIFRTQQILLKLKGNVKQRLSFFSKQTENESDARVTLLTIHGAKGLEADTVFLIGLSDKKMPAAKAEQEASRRGSKFQNIMLEEERRLFYVGITRAQRVLHLSAFQGTHMRPDSNGYSKLIPPQLIDTLPSIHNIESD